MNESFSLSRFVLLCVWLSLSVGCGADRQLSGDSSVSDSAVKVDASSQADGTVIDAARADLDQPPDGRLPPRDFRIPDFSLPDGLSIPDGFRPSDIYLITDVSTPDLAPFPDGSGTTCPTVSGAYLILALPNQPSLCNLIIPTGSAVQCSVAQNGCKIDVSCSGLPVTLQASVDQAGQAKGQLSVAGFAVNYAFQFAPNGLEATFTAAVAGASCKYAGPKK
ncbi:MAG: hypothetical protein H6707_10220 [Deltaproteobacteria bacterium]|nr:hypothetical protein [Deltaproteobacteria bacterium]